MGVAFAAPAALGQDETLSRIEEVCQELPGVGVKDPGAQGNPDDQGRAAFAVAILALPPAAGWGLEEAAAPEFAQSAQGGGGLQHHISAGAAVTAVRSAPGLEPGSLETDTARSAVAGPCGDLYLIGKGLQIGG